MYEVTMASVNKEEREREMDIYRNGEAGAERENRAEERRTDGNEDAEAEREKRSEKRIIDGHENIEIEKERREGIAGDDMREEVEKNNEEADKDNKGQRDRESEERPSSMPSFSLRIEDVENPTPSNNMNEAQVETTEKIGDKLQSPYL